MQREKAKVRPKQTTYLASEMVAMSTDNMKELRHVQRIKNQRKQLIDNYNEFQFQHTGGGIEALRKLELESLIQHNLSHINNERSPSKLKGTIQITDQKPEGEDGEPAVQIEDVPPTFEQLRAQGMLRPIYPFNTMSREQRDQIEAERLLKIPGVGRYYPNYSLVYEKPF